jgi:hypothetical protein
LPEGNEQASELHEAEEVLEVENQWSWLAQIAAWSDALSIGLTTAWSI